MVLQKKTRRLAEVKSSWLILFLFLVGLSHGSSHPGKNGQDIIASEEIRAVCADLVLPFQVKFPSSLSQGSVVDFLSQGWVSRFSFYVVAVVSLLPWASEIELTNSGEVKSLPLPRFLDSEINTHKSNNKE